MEGVAKFVTANAESVLVGEVELTEKFLGYEDGGFGAFDFEDGIAGDEFDAEEGLSFAKEGFVRGVEIGEGPCVIESENLFAHRLLVLLGRKEEGGSTIM